MSQTAADENSPRFAYTDEIVDNLMIIAGAAQLVETLVVPPDSAPTIRPVSRETSWTWMR